MNPSNFIWFNVADIIAAHQEQLITHDEATDYVKQIFNAGCPKEETVNG